MRDILKTTVKGLVENYYIIQETRKALDLREQALCRDEIIMYEQDREGKDKKYNGFITHEDDNTVIIMKKAKNGNKTEKEINRRDVRKIIYHKFKSVEEAQKELFKFPVGQREADVSSVPLKRMEEDIKKQISRLIKDWPVWDGWLKNVSGVGPVTAGGLLAYVDIYKASKVSSLWHYAGQHVVDGEIPRLKKKVKRSWNRRLQTIMWNFSECIVKLGVGYRALYKERKAYEIANRFFSLNLRNGKSEDDLASFIAGHLLNEPVGKKKKGYFVQNKVAALKVLRDKNGNDELLLERKPGHIDNRAKRFVRKVFLSHVYEYWRGVEGLPVRPVYPIGKDPSHEPIPIILK